MKYQQGKKTCEAPAEKEEPVVHQQGKKTFVSLSLSCLVKRHGCVTSMGVTIYN